MNDTRLKRLFNELAAEDQGARAPEVWPAVRFALLERQTQKQGANMKTPFLKNAWAYAAALTLLAFIAFGAFTPQGKVLAQSIIRFFKPSTAEQVVLPTQPLPLVEANENQPVEAMVPIESIEQTPVHCNDQDFPRCSLEEVLPYLSFEPKLPQDLPDGFQFGGAKAEANSLWVYYENPGGGLYLFETPVSDRPLTFPVGVSAQIRPATVAGMPAEYVEGYWQAGTSFDSQEWVADENAQYLAWQDAELQYRLTSLGAKVPESLRLGQEALQAIANSLSPQQFEAASAEASLSPQELAAKAGFEFMEPRQLPPGFSRGKTTNNPAWGSVCQSYEPLEGDGWPLILAEWHGNLPSVEQLTLQELVQGHQIQTNITNLPVRGADGGMGTLLDNGIVVNVVCSDLDERANQVLIWKQGNRSHAIFFPWQDHRGRPFATQMEVVRMAEQINGMPIEEVPALDPFRLPSLQAASQVYGTPVAFPRQLFPGFHLQNFAVWDNPVNKMAITSFVKQANLEYGGVWQKPAEAAGLTNQDNSEKVSVWGQDGYLYSYCQLDPLTGINHCSSTLTWLASGQEYSVHFNLLRPISPEEMLSIAESMRP